MANIKMPLLYREVPPVSSNSWWTQLLCLPTSPLCWSFFSLYSLVFRRGRYSTKQLPKLEQILMFVTDWAHNSWSSASANCTSCRR